MKLQRKQICIQNSLNELKKINKILKTEKILYDKLQIKLYNILEYIQIKIIIKLNFKIKMHNHMHINNTINILIIKYYYSNIMMNKIINK